MSTGLTSSPSKPSATGGWMTATRSDHDFCACQVSCGEGTLWRRASVARGLVPVGVRSAPKIFDSCRDFGAAAQPNGDKSPRHRIARCSLLGAPPIKTDQQQRNHHKPHQQPPGIHKHLWITQLADINERIGINRQQMPAPQRIREVHQLDRSPTPRYAAVATCLSAHSTTNKPETAAA